MWNRQSSSAGETVGNRDADWSGYRYCIVADRARAISRQRVRLLPSGIAAFCQCDLRRVVSSVALPYTQIPAALAEIRRVLRPEGTLFMSLHHLGITLKELRAAFPRPAVRAFRLYVIANGLFLHLPGRTVKFPNGGVESFQNKKGYDNCAAARRFRENCVHPTRRTADRGSHCRSRSRKMKWEASIKRPIPIH